ncbi:Receptor-like protein 12 [Nymphaea thermarum]|nr:Receptor-like protein 12 [Nymphaea thermarum]
MTYFSALNNLIVGEIPTFICNLTELEALDMSNNVLTSTIPKCLGSLQLKFLNLAENHLQDPEHLCSVSSEALAPPHLFSDKDVLGFSHLDSPASIQVHIRFGPSSINIVSCDGVRHIKLIRSGSGSNGGLSSLQHLALDEIAISMSSKSVSVIKSSSLPGLQTLSLESCNISGILDESILQLLSLAYMNLSRNELFYIPEFFQNFTSLRVLKLAYCSIRSFPSGIFLLPELEILDVSRNDYPQKLFHQPHYPEPWGQLLKWDDSINQLTGGISAAIVNLPSLTELHLSSNMLTGSIPSSLLNLLSLVVLVLANNRFNGSLPNFFNQLPKLTYLQLDNNCFSGIIPSSISTLSALLVAHLSSNSINGTMDLSPFMSLQILEFLDLSNNRGLTELVPSNSSYSYVGSVQFLALNLSSCNIDSFPPFPQVNLGTLDLSNNRVRGKVPSWSWRNFYLESLLLNHNNIDGFEAVNGSSLQNSQIAYFSALNNLIVGEIPTFICNLTELEALDMSNNGLTSTIPKNHLQGQVPPMNSTLELVSLDNNLMSGKIGPRAFHNCINLGLLDLGNNQFNDTFPSSLSSFPNLKVLVLRANHLHGAITLSGSGEAFSSLHILDISGNHLSGSLPQELFTSLKDMMVNESKGNGYLSSRIGYYTFSVVQTFKGTTVLIPEISNIMFIINLSSNMFYDRILDEIGMLEALILLNISNNNLSGTIPVSLGNVQQMEALDLSNNHLCGGVRWNSLILHFL